MDDQFRSTLGTYDTILADYLIGAVDGFSPYEQDTIIKKLKDHLNPNGKLYVIGGLFVTRFNMRILKLLSALYA